MVALPPEAVRHPDVYHRQETFSPSIDASTMHTQLLSLQARYKQIMDNRGMPSGYTLIPGLPTKDPSSLDMKATATSLPTENVPDFIATPIPPQSLTLVDAKVDVTSPFEALRKGHLLTKKKELTFLIVGETGVGKTAFLSLVANVLQGRDHSDYQVVHDPSNEAGGPLNGSQTNQARAYEFRSLNGVVVRVLDTPGLADTRGLKYDQAHKASIAKAIHAAIPVIDGVLIITNGTNPRLSVSTDYALTTLASIFPRSIERNIAVLFTMISNPLSFNFEMDSLPCCMQEVETFLLDNPIALRKRFDQKAKSVGSSMARELKKMVDRAHMSALERLADFFSWLDSREVQATTAIVDLHNSACEIDRKIRDALARMEDAADKKKKLREIEQDASNADRAMKAYKEFETVMTMKVRVQTHTPNHNTICSYPQCRENCHRGCQLDFSTNADLLRGCWAFSGSTTCRSCSHSFTYHYHDHTIWEDKEDRQRKVDWSAKEKFEAAAKDKTKYQSALDEVKKVISGLDREIAATTRDIGKLCQSYAALSLSGSFAGQILKSIRLLEVHLESLESDKHADQDTVHLVRDSIETLKKQHQVLDNAAKEAFQLTVPHIKNFRFF